MHNVGRILIIGAGPTGLGAAYRLNDLGYTDFLVVDTQPQAGGLSSSYVDNNGFTWDIGGHVQFSHYDYFDRAMERALGADGWFNHERESWVWIADRLVPYPFQYNIRTLPKEMVAKAISGLLSRDTHDGKKPANFGEWIDRVFGKGLRDIFMEPYNYKVWAFPVERLSCGWVGERVAVVDAARVVDNILAGRDEVSWGPNNTFQFPKLGGTGAIWRGIADQVGDQHLRYNTRIASIDWKKRVAYTGDGEALEYDRLLSTMPLDTLCDTITPSNDHAIAESRKLLRSTSHIIGIGLTGEMPEKLNKKCWLYFPEDNCPFYRVTVFSHYSINNVPEPESGKYWSLMAETSESDVKFVNSDTIVEDTIQGLQNTGMIRSRDQVVSRWSYVAKHGYPTPSVERDALLANVFRDLKETGIASRGRFGAWRYEVSNQDHSFMQGVEWVNSELLDVPELTVRFAETANQNWGKAGL